MDTTPERSVVRETISQWRAQGDTIAFVPTMGSLHEGHLSLVRLAKERASRVVCSIFVNPTQFNDAKDFENYPDELEQDAALLRELEVDLLYAPQKEMLYGDHFQSWVENEELARSFEGEGRPGHFRGVTTVVTMLFLIVQPDVAVFGEKDFQQLRIIEQLVDDLKFPIEIVRGPLIREEDGLAMSSRNVRLSPAGRQEALQISRVLMTARERYLSEKCSLEELQKFLSEGLANFKVFYLAIVEEETLVEIRSGADIKAPRILCAVEVEGVRLLDTIALS